MGDDRADDGDCGEVVVVVRTSIPNGKEPLIAGVAVVMEEVSRSNDKSSSSIENGVVWSEVVAEERSVSVEREAVCW